MALTVYNGDLVAGGPFHTVGGAVSAYWAKWGVPTVIEGDLNHDCYVDYFDLDWFTDNWLLDYCECMGFCYEADLNYDGQVDFLDYAILASHWLQGIGP
jgi:hypothetical protein